MQSKLKETYQARLLLYYWAQLPVWSSRQQQLVHHWNPWHLYAVAPSQGPILHVPSWQILALCC